MRTIAAADAEIGRETCGSSDLCRVLTRPRSSLARSMRWRASASSKITQIRMKAIHADDCSSRCRDRKRDVWLFRSVQGFDAAPVELGTIDEMAGERVEQDHADQNEGDPCGRLQQQMQRSEERRVALPICAGF